MGLALTPSSGRSKYERVVRDLADYFYYVGAVCPEYSRPLQDEMAAASDDQLANFQLTFPTWLYLFSGASDECALRIAERLAQPDLTPLARFSLESMLAAICTPAALTSLAIYVRSSRRTTAFEDLGFWIPPNDGAAVPRFTLPRFAARLRRADGGDISSYRHPVGLAESSIATGQARELITWHYCSLDSRDIPGAAALSHPLIHLVSPKRWDNWTVFSWFAADGRYDRAVLSEASEKDSDDLDELLDEANDDTTTGQGQIVLAPYDDQLVYCNSNIHLTPEVVGDVGGPPIGLYPNPTCPTCNKLMFHIATMTCDVREYGDGFRSLFICEDCDIVASHATGWN